MSIVGIIAITVGIVIVHRERIRLIRELNATEGI